MGNLSADKWWSLNKKLNVNRDILDFKTRIAEVRAIFSDRSLVCQASAMDTILQVIWKTRQEQRRINATLRKIRATQAEQFELMNGRLDAAKEEDARHREEEQQRRQAEERREYVWQMLSMHAIGNTSYDKQGKPPCDKETRVDLLKEIMGWVEDVSASSRNFLWLTGDPGSGKSAITASIARACKDKDILWAQFFINRNSVDTTNPNAYFPSIARQLAERSELVQLEIHEQLKSKPSLMDEMSSEQATSLFIDAIRVASKIDQAKPVVIVIDGLDETDRNHLRSTADIFSQLFEELSNHRNAKVYIASRTEDDIRTPFARTMSDKRVKHLHLDTASTSSVEDVSRFLRRRLVQIVLDNDLDWRVWPGNERFDMLAIKAAGLFIWAVTAVKFIQEQLDYWGKECLDDILDKLNSNGMGDINTLYGLILLITYRKADEWAFESFRRIIGAVVALHEPMCINDISFLLDLRRSPSSSQVDVLRFVKRLRTVLVAGAGAIDGETVPRLHKSFFEFITSENRVESRFRVDPDASHLELGVQCLRQLALARSATSSFRIPAVFRYAFRFCSQHFLQGSGTAAGVAIPTGTWNLPDFQSILQQSSNSDYAAPLFVTYSSEKSSIQASLGNASNTNAWDITTGVMQTTLTSDAIFSDFMPSCSKVAFLPDGKHLALASHDRYIRLLDTKLTCTAKQQFITTDTKLRAISGCFSFSPDRSTFAVVGKDGQLCLRDTYTGEAVGAPFFGHTPLITHVCFSPVGHRLLAGYDDGVIQIWNLENGVHLEKHFRGHISRVSAAIISHDGKYSLSRAYEDSACLWNLESGEMRHLRHPSKRWETHVAAVAFSPNGRLAAISGDYPGTISFWDVQVGEIVGQLLEGHSGTICSIDFSPDGTHIVSGSYDKTIRIWDVETRQLIGEPMASHKTAVSSVAFSPDGNQICSFSGDYTLRIWNNDLRDTFDTRMSGFSPNGELIFSVSQDDHIRLWDPRAGRHDGLLLEGQARDLRFIALSHDGSRLAASSSNAISIWDTGTGRHLAQSKATPGSTIDSCYFTPHSQSLFTTLSTGNMVVWEEQNGELEIYTPSDISQLHTVTAPPFFDVKADHYFDGLGGTRWFPSNNPDSGLWAFVDSHIIRIRKDGSMTIVPVTQT
ncbi:hypothetical protein FPV67DRAFT_221177 [Lyophyllum atratum]|nr:hypothetical protein FPV67DRAFT_221177 [Lyophyllum atratum]